MPERRFTILIAATLILSPGTAAADESVDRRIIHDVTYYDGPGSDSVRHRLDIYLPADEKDFPVLMFLHGGAWTRGDKNQLGVYHALARAFTRHGIAVVCPNYRLSPGVQHPEHIRDVARAFAWTYRNIEKYGGNKREIFVGGHSAGGHLCALLATDPAYLKENGLSLRDIRGAVPVSGLFTIPEDRVFESIFGPDPGVRKQASPVRHVDGDEPPFLVILADNELPACDLPQAQNFCVALKKSEIPYQFLQVPRRNHVSILLNAVRDSDPATRAMLSFICTHVTLHRLERGGREMVDCVGEFIARYGR